MTKSMIQIKAELNMFSFSVDNRPYYWECKVCGNKFKTERGTYSHIDRKDHTKPVTKEMDRIIAQGDDKMKQTIINNFIDKSVKMPSYAPAKLVMEKWGEWCISNPNGTYAEWKKYLNSLKAGGE